MPVTFRPSGWDVRSVSLKTPSTNTCGSPTSRPVEPGGALQRSTLPQHSSYDEAGPHVGPASSYVGGFLWSSATTKVNAADPAAVRVLAGSDPGQAVGPVQHDVPVFW